MEITFASIMELKVLFLLMALIAFMSFMIWSTRPKRRNYSLVFTYFGNDSFKIKSSQMATIFKANQFAEFQVAFVDRKGNPAQVDEDSVSYESPDPEVTVEENPDDQTKFKVTTSATPVTESRTVDIKISADADMGDGVKTLEGSLTVVLEPEMAEGMSIATLTPPQDVS